MIKLLLPQKKTQFFFLISFYNLISNQYTMGFHKQCSLALIIKKIVVRNYKHNRTMVSLNWRFKNKKDEEDTSQFLLPWKTNLK